MNSLESAPLAARQAESCTIRAACGPSWVAVSLALGVLAIFAPSDPFRTGTEQTLLREAVTGPGSGLAYEWLGGLLLAAWSGFLAPDTETWLAAALLRGLLVALGLLSCRVLRITVNPVVVVAIAFTGLQPLSQAYAFALAPLILGLGTGTGMSLTLGIVGGVLWLPLTDRPVLLILFLLAAGCLGAMRTRLLLVAAVGLGPWIVILAQTLADFHARTWPSNSLTVLTVTGWQSPNLHFEPGIVFGITTLVALALLAGRRTSLARFLMVLAIVCALTSKHFQIFAAYALALMIESSPPITLGTQGGFSREVGFARATLLSILIRVPYLGLLVPLVGLKARLIEDQQAREIQAQLRRQLRPLTTDSGLVLADHRASDVVSGAGLTPFIDMRGDNWIQDDNEALTGARLLDYAEVYQLDRWREVVERWRFPLAVLRRSSPQAELFGSVLHWCKLGETAAMTVSADGRPATLGYSIWARPGTEHCQGPPAITPPQAHAEPKPVSERTNQDSP